jgi:hypothetical protein
VLQQHLLLSFTTTPHTYFIEEDTPKLDHCSLRYIWMYKIIYIQGVYIYIYIYIYLNLIKIHFDIMFILTKLFRTGGVLHSSEKIKHKVSHIGIA